MLAAPSTRLHLRFAAATAVVIATVGGVLLLYVRHHEVQAAERGVVTHARFVEKSILHYELRPSDLAGPVRGVRLAQLDRLFRERVLVDGGLRIKLYRAPDGVVVYSNVHSLIGTKIDDMGEFRTILGGRSVRDISYLNHEGGSGKNVKALEVYVPLRLRGQAAPGAALEIYASYAPVSAAVMSFVLPFGLLLLVALLGMWAALFPLVRGMVRSLERSRAGHHAAELSLEETSEQLRQSQKMDAVGSLAGGVAHDFNNLLTAINGYAALLRAEPGSARTHEFAAAIGNAGERAAALTQQLLAFSRRQVLRPDVMSLNDVVLGMTSLLERLIGERITIELELDPDLQPTEADRSTLDQVLLNLVVNARDAMAGSGTVTISTRNEGDLVVLEVSDTGVGMDQATAERIFEPFFTTKDVGMGTGLGLSTVYGIVTQTGGTIHVRSAPGEGATFTVRLPATQRELEAVVDALESAPGGHERVLVVDDEQAICEVLAASLRSQGYDVTTATSAAEARSLEGPWDLLLTDVVMPGTDGVTLAREIDAPHTLFMSGYDADGLTTQEAHFLQKPFELPELARAMRRLLNGPARSTPFQPSGKNGAPPPEKVLETPLV
jgi:signal transduction histidine kinase